MAKGTPEEQERSKATLQKYLGDGGTIFTITRYAKSRMSRWVRVLIVVSDPAYRNGEPDLFDITHDLSVTVGRPLGDDGLKFSGTGFDADDYIVQDIQHVLGLEPIRHANGYREDKIRSRKLMSY